MCPHMTHDSSRAVHVADAAHATGVHVLAGMGHVVSVTGGAFRTRVVAIPQIEHF